MHRKVLTAVVILQQRILVTRKLTSFTWSWGERTRAQAPLPPISSKSRALSISKALPSFLAGSWQSFIPCYERRPISLATITMLRRAFLHARQPLCGGADHETARTVLHAITHLPQTKLTGASRVCQMLGDIGPFERLSRESELQMVAPTPEPLGGQSQRARCHDRWPTQYRAGVGALRVRRYASRRREREKCAMRDAPIDSFYKCTPANGTLG